MIGAGRAAPERGGRESDRENAEASRRWSSVVKESPGNQLRSAGRPVATPRSGALAQPGSKASNLSLSRQSSEQYNALPGEPRDQLLLSLSPRPDLSPFRTIRSG